MKLVPMYMAGALILLIGIFPELSVRILSSPVSELTGYPSLVAYPENTAGLKFIRMTGYVSVTFIMLTAFLFLVRRWLTAGRPVSIQPTWGCGYTGPSGKMQYTASSFVRPFRKLAEPLLTITRMKKEISGIFPGKGEYVTRPQDKLEEVLIKSPVSLLKRFLNLFSFLQHGNPQIYVLYGLVFIILISALPALYDFVHSIILFLKNI
jgi:hypothetical protein